MKIKCEKCGNEIEITETTAASALGKKGGSSTSEKKRAASRLNGLKHKKKID
jgi:hypothetical protein